MYAGQTLFIVGAGASKELGLPLGSELRNEISQLLTISQQTVRRYQGMASPVNLFDTPAETEFYRYLYQEAFPQIVEGGASPITLSIGDRIKLWHQVGRGVQFSSSIDNYLHNRSGTADIIEIGKAAVTWIISQSERALEGRMYAGKRSTEWLKVPRRADQTREAERTFAWTTYFAEQCFALTEEKQIEDALSRVRFVVFNYDRCVEQFIAVALQNIFGLDADTAAKHVSRATFIHPYGDLGKLSEVPFGAWPPSRDAIQRFKTFTQQQGSETVDEIGKAASWADNIMFLGSAYHPANMEILSHNARRNVRIWGTSKGLSETANAEAKRQIRAAFGLPETHDVALKDMTCGELLAAEAVALTEYKRRK